MSRGRGTGLLRFLLEVVERIWLAGGRWVDREHHSRRTMVNLSAVEPERLSMMLGNDEVFVGRWVGIRGNRDTTFRHQRSDPCACRISESTYNPVLKP